MKSTENIENQQGQDRSSSPFISRRENEERFDKLQSEISSLKSLMYKLRNKMSRSLGKTTLQLRHLLHVSSRLKIIQFVKNLIRRGII